MFPSSQSSCRAGSYVCAYLWTTLDLIQLSYGLAAHESITFLFASCSSSHVTGQEMDTVSLSLSLLPGMTALSFLS